MSNIKKKLKKKKKYGKQGQPRVGGWEVGVAVYWPRVALIYGEGANLRIYTYNLHLPIKGFSLRSNT